MRDGTTALGVEKPIAIDDSVVRVGQAAVVAGWRCGFRPAPKADACSD